jgi:cytochrome c oxidase subunit 2
MFDVLPPAASRYAAEVDHLYFGLLIISGLVLLAVFVLLIGFAAYYRRGSTVERSHRTRKSWHWEISWTFATLLAFVGLFFWGADLYARLLEPPANTLDLYVVGKQWMWKAQHPDGQREIDEVHVPVGRPVRLIMISQDVIHSFFVPALRVKQDVLPGRYVSLWFEAVQTGEFPLYCAEFCGTEHAHMGGRIVVLEPAAFERWLSEQAPSESLAASGEKLFRSLGCSGCHDGAGTVRAPSLQDLYGRPVPLSDGRVVTADDRYIRDSILLPRAEIAAGYAPVMPSFAGRLGEDELLELIAYIKSLSTGRRAAP